MERGAGGEVHDDANPAKGAMRGVAQALLKAGDGPPGKAFALKKFE